MIINKSGLTIRMHVSDIRVAGRATQGVRLINLRGNDMIASVTQVPRTEDEEDSIEKPVDGTGAVPTDVPAEKDLPENTDSL